MKKKWLYILSPFRIVVILFIVFAVKLFTEKESNSEPVKCGLGSPAFMLIMLTFFMLTILAIDFLVKVIFPREKVFWLWLIEGLLVGILLIYIGTLPY